jgi:uracil-DNA glycosylase family 4
MPRLSSAQVGRHGRSPVGYHSGDDLVACRPWLAAELDLLRPEVVVCPGATAAKAIFGPSFRITRRRGVLMLAPELGDLPWPDGDGPPILATIHPSAVLRADDRTAMRAGLVEDLRVAAVVLGQRCDGSVSASGGADRGGSAGTPVGGGCGAR